MKHSIKAWAAAAIGAAAMMVCAPAQAQDLSEEVNQDLAYLQELYLYLHANPELSYQEEKTAQRISQELRQIGFEVTERVGTYDNIEGKAFGVVGVLVNGDGPTVMLRTDLDGLPVVEQTGLAYASQVRATEQTGQSVGVMHACAHDMHMAIFVGAARWLAANRDKWSGTVLVIGQPAEERGAGALAMLKDGLYERFPRPDYNLGMHVWGFRPAGEISYVPGYALANVDSVDITVRGIGGHGSAPHFTKDPVVIAAQIINGLQTIVSREVDPLDSAVVTVGSIHGGAKHNIISDKLEMQLTVRSYKDDTRQKVLDSIERISLNIARAAGVPEDLLPIVHVRAEESIPSTYNDPVLTDRLATHLITYFDSSVVVKGTPIMGGEDFSYFGREEPIIPTVMLGLGGADPAAFATSQESGIPLPSNHSPLFAPVIDPTLENGVQAIVQATLALVGKT